MDFEKLKKQLLYDLKRGEKYLLIEYRRLKKLKEVLEDIYAASEIKNPKIADLSKPSLKKIKSMLRKTSRTEYRRYAWHLMAEENLREIISIIKPEFRDKFNELIKEFEVDNSQIVIFTRYNGILSDIFEEKPVKGFDSSVYSVIELIQDKLMASRISSMLSVVSNIRGFLGREEVRIISVRLDIATEIPKLTAASTHIIIDSSFIKALDVYRQAAKADSFFINSGKSRLILLDCVVRELSQRQALKTGGLVKQSTINYLIGLAGAITSAEPAKEERDYLLSIYSFYPRKKNIGSFQQGADIRILTYAYRRGLRHEPTIILTHDEDIISIAEFLREQRRMFITTLSLSQLAKAVA